MPAIYDRLAAFNKNRLPEMLKYKYKAMALNVFSFYRGTCHLFYQDLAAAKPLPLSPLTWICGDLHLENFGCFKGDDHQVYFDLNDFDEAMLAPAACELARMLTAIFVEFDNLGLAKKEAIKTARMFLDTYSSVLKNGKAISIDPRTANGLVQEFLKAAETRKQKELLKKRTYVKKGEVLLLPDNDRHFVIEKGLKKELMQFIGEGFKNINGLAFNYKVVDCIFRLAGTGSIGVKRYMFLLKNQDLKKKYLLLDMKQAMPSSLEPYVQIPQPQWATEAERVVAIQHSIQNVNPALLTPVVFKNDPYIINQLQPVEDKIDLSQIKDNVPSIEKVINDMAVLSASAQLRSSGRRGSATADELIAFGENNEWYAAILSYAAQYAMQVKKDFKEFVTGYKSGLYQQQANGKNT